MSTGGDDGKNRGERQELRQGPRKLYQSLKVYHLAGQSVPVGFKVYQHQILGYCPHLQPHGLL